MIGLTKAFRRKLFNDERNYLSYADITLASGTTLHLTNEQLWTGGFAKEDAVSDDNSFTALGSTIIGSSTIVINNIDEEYSDYDFYKATVVTYIAMELEDGDSTRLEKPKMGTYTVDETRYNGSLITLELLDNMEKFDRPYSTCQLVYPATLDQIVRNACESCGVPFAASSLEFPHKDFSIPVKPESDSLTYREVIGWVAAIAGRFARCNRDGELELGWFDQQTLEAWEAGYDGGSFDNAVSGRYTTGDSVDGGEFNPWETGDVVDGGGISGLPMHYIHGLFSQDICTDDVVITGVKITVKNEGDEASSDTLDFTVGNSGYMIQITNNDMLTPANAQEVATWLGTQLIGLRFRKASVTHANDPAIEAGDVGVLIDRKGREYPILITRTNFAVGDTQTTVSGAETPSRNSATRYSQQSKGYVESRKLLKQQKTTYDKAIEDLSKAMASMKGLYTTIEAGDSGSIFYLHDAPELANSNTVWKMTADAWAVTNDYKGSDTVWNGGMTVDGTMIAKVLSTIGLNFDWGTGGTLTLGGQDNKNGEMRILDASGSETGRFNNVGINMNGGKFTVDDKGNVQAMSITAYGSLICYEHYTIT